MHSDLPDKLNFLGQVYTAMGRFEDAETVLTESIQLLGDDEVSPWSGYNSALLGKLYLESSRVDTR
jgi:cytochrome c-type biogenesis protein CcmH/NrfG